MRLSVIRNRRKWFKEVLSFASLVLVVFAARSSLADHYHVPTGSMRPTVEIGDHILVNKLAYGLRLPFSTWYLAEFDWPQSGDVVVLNSPEDKEVLLKRVIGVPGDRVQVDKGHIVINGHSQELTPGPEGLVEMLSGKAHAVRLTHGGGPDMGPLRVPEGSYLVMGDNRGQSRDGRLFGFVSRSAILGRAEVVFLRGSRLCWHSL